MQARVEYSTYERRMLLFFRSLNAGIEGLEESDESVQENDMGTFSSDGRAAALFLREFTRHLELMGRYFARVRVGDLCMEYLDRIQFEVKRMSGGLAMRREDAVHGKGDDKAEKFGPSFEYGMRQAEILEDHMKRISSIYNDFYQKYLQSSVQANDSMEGMKTKLDRMVRIVGDCLKNMEVIDDEEYDADHKGYASDDSVDPEDIAR